MPNRLLSIVSVLVVVVTAGRIRIDKAMASKQAVDTIVTEAGNAEDTNAQNNSNNVEHIRGVLRPVPNIIQRMKPRNKRKPAAPKGVGGGGFFSEDVDYGQSLAPTVELNRCESWPSDKKRRGCNSAAGRDWLFLDQRMAKILEEEVHGTNTSAIEACRYACKEHVIEEEGACCFFYGHVNQRGEFIATCAIKDGSFVTVEGDDDLDGDLSSFAIPSGKMVEHESSLINLKTSDAVRQAAKVISEADFLLLAGGAGLSADSGLITFASFNERLGNLLGDGLTYDQAAGSDMMVKDPRLFYGFWFYSARNYQNAQPHEGYHILRSWREQKEQRLAEKEGPEDGKHEIPLVFTMTSNVDSFLKRSGVPSHGALAQIHGSMEKWQCGGVPSGSKFPLFSRGRCCDDVFDPPSGEGMDYETMRYDGSAPSCPRCNEGWLRPHVYLFGDGSRFVNKEEETGEQAYRTWSQELIAKLKANSRLRLTIVEIGCGLRVPNIRKRCEELFAACPSGQSEFVRINPEITKEQFRAQPTVFVQAGALEGLKHINSCMIGF